MEGVSDKEKLLRVVVKLKKKRKVRKPDIPRLKVDKMAATDFIDTLHAVDLLETGTDKLRKDLKNLK